MKTVKVAQTPPKDIVYLDSLKENIPLFLRQYGKLKGMIVKEDEGWISRLGGPVGSSGHYETRQQCMEAAYSYGYEACIED